MHRTEDQFDMRKNYLKSLFQFNNISIEDLKNILSISLTRRGTMANHTKPFLMRAHAVVEGIFH